MVAPSDYRTSIVEGDTIMDLTADIVSYREGVDLYFKIDFDDDGEEKEEHSFIRFSFESPTFVYNWTPQFLSETISDLPYSQRRKARLAAWAETIYYHIDYTIQELQVPDSWNLSGGVFFKMDFLPTSPQAMESLGLSADCGGTGSTGGNLLKRIKLCDDDAGEWRKDDGCSICFEGFEVEHCGRGEDLTRMPCFHAFHYTCLAEWLGRSYTCPMCRHKLNWNTVIVKD